MNYYEKEFEKLQEEFHEVMHNYPLFKEIIDEIEEKNIKEINELLEKNDEYYLKKAIDKLKDLIKFIKNTSTCIKNEYEKYNKLALIWEKIKIHDTSDIELAMINDRVNKANQLINSHEVKDLIEANKIMEVLIKENE